MTHPKDLPLSELFQVKAVCEDCGRRTVYDRHRVAKDQLRRQLATPEEVGSFYTCEYCQKSGGEGKNISVQIISRGGHVTQLLRDLRPASLVNSITGECQNCGHLAKFGRDKLVEFPPNLTVHDIWLKAVCSPCKAAGAPHPRVVITVDPPMPTKSRPAPPIKWSRAEVFTDDRSDPYPNLPRRLFGQIQEDV